MNLRGAWAPAPADTTKVNVTSAQGLANKNRRDFSPMTQIEGGYEGFWNFEAFWQSGKVFEGISEQKVKTFWHNVTEAKRRYPGSKGKKVLHAHFECEPDQLMDYVTSRKQIYVPRYTALIQDREMTLFWKQQVDAGTNIVIYDFDGPRTIDGAVSCVEVTTELLRDKINDTHFPFGHGYIVAALLKGIPTDEYLM